MRKTLFITAFVCMFFNLSSAQKIAHFNSLDIISQLPEIKAADVKLATLQDSLGNALTVEQTKLQEEFSQHQMDYQAGSLTTKQVEEISAQMQEKQSALQTQESEFQQILLERRQKLYQPTFDKLDAIIQQVASEEGFEMIFDSSKPGFLYLNSALDISELIEQRVLN